VNHATDVYTLLPPNVDPVPWLASLGYVKKPQDSSTYERAAQRPEGSFMESTITNGKPKLTGLKVLVIDDSKTIRQTAETLLTKVVRSLRPSTGSMRCPRSPTTNLISSSWTS
jgi:PleD family two-component response regulator